MNEKSPLRASLTLWSNLILRTAIVMLVGYPLALWVGAALKEATGRASTAGESHAFAILLSFVVAFWLSVRTTDEDASLSYLRRTLRFTKLVYVDGARTLLILGVALAVVLTVIGIPLALLVLILA